MSRIKGRYVAKLIVDIDIERTDVMPSLDIIKKNFRAFPNYLIGSLKDETDLSCLMLTVTRILLNVQTVKHTGRGGIAQTKRELKHGMKEKHKFVHRTRLTS